MQQDPHDGFISASFTLASPRVFFIISLWKDEKAIARFWSDVPEHIAAVHAVTPMLARHGTGPIIWSTTWQPLDTPDFAVWPENGG